MTYETDYGYWIAPDGSVLAVCLCEHEAYKGYEEADEEGWIRMVVIPEEDTMSIGLNPDTVSKAAARTALHIIQDNHERTVYMAACDQDAETTYRTSEYTNREARTELAAIVKQRHNEAGDYHDQ